MLTLGTAMQTPLRQFKGIPTEVLARMEKKDLAWERYYDLTAQELGELIRVPKLGKSLHRFVHQFPRLELAAHVQPITRTVIKVGFRQTYPGWGVGVHFRYCQALDWALHSWLSGLTKLELMQTLNQGSPARDDQF